jgi:hypothetical protein
MGMQMAHIRSGRAGLAHSRRREDTLKKKSRFVLKPKGISYFS